MINGKCFLSLLGLPVRRPRAGGPAKIRPPDDGARPAPNRPAAETPRRDEDPNPRRGGCRPSSNSTKFCWSGREDLNLRPTAPKAVMLPGCTTPRKLASKQVRRRRRAGRVTGSFPELYILAQTVPEVQFFSKSAAPLPRLFAAGPLLERPIPEKV